MSTPFAQHLSSLHSKLVVLAQQTCPALTATAQSMCVKHEKVLGLYSLTATKCLTLQTNWLAQTLMFWVWIMFTCNTLKLLLLRYLPAGAAIAKFLASYRSTFPGATFPGATVLPKMHFLEDHAVPWIKKWKTGFGFLWEQGGESIHKQFNALERSYNCISNKVERLHCMMEAHHTQVCPELEERSSGSCSEKEESFIVVLYP